MKTTQSVTLSVSDNELSYQTLLVILPGIQFIFDIVCQRQLIQSLHITLTATTVVKLSINQLFMLGGNLL